MKILLINANFVHNHTLTTRLLIKTVVNPSLVLPYVAASIPPQHTVKCIEDSYQDINYDEDCDLVGISTATPSAPRAYHIADEFRKRGKTVVLGGIHPTVMPREAAEHADAVVSGEAETNFPQLLHDFEHNQIKQFYRRNCRLSAQQIPAPNRRVNQITPLLAGVQTSRGCPYNCEFCTLARVNGTTYRSIPVDRVIEEMKQIPRKFLIMIHDASLTIDPDYTKKLFKRMQPLNKKFICYGSAPVLAKHEEILPLAKKAGCAFWAIGFETISQSSLNEVHKGYKASMYNSLITKIKDHGMGVFGSFIFGFDHDSPDIFENTLQALHAWDIDAAEFNILTPFPGTNIFKKLKREQRILTTDWSKYDLRHPVFQPKQMTPQELFTGVRQVAADYYSVPNMVKRALSLKKWGLAKFLYTVGLNTGMLMFHSEGYHFHDKKLPQDLPQETVSAHEHLNRGKLPLHEKAL